MLKETIRKVLLRILIWTEKKPIRPKIYHEIPFWNREIHIPASIIIVVNILIIFSVLMLEIQPTIIKLLGLLLLVVIISLLFILLYIRYLPELAKDSNAIMLTGVIVSFSVLLAGASRAVEVISPFIIPVAGIVLLTAILLNEFVGLLLSGLLAFVIPALFGFRLELALYYLIPSIFAMTLPKKIFHRQDITSAGVRIAFVNFISVISLTLSGLIDFNYLNILWSLVNGIICAILVLGLLSPLETFFSRTTNIKLIELADFNQPILKRLMVEAPGTYHHSLTVATIAEQASELVNANSLLVRVGAFYHDIGKLIKPEYFIENQIAMENPHDFVLPSMSGLVITSHVKEGVNIAKQQKLDRSIIELIEQHHGTSLIHLFYQKALESTAEAKEESFRYPGPKPNTKEAAILMLADSCEAACRTIEKISPGKIKDTVEKIINNKFTDGQLDDSPLTLQDLHKIAESIITTLTGIHHARIEYEEKQE